MTHSDNHPDLINSPPFSLKKSYTQDGYDLTITHDQTEDLAYHCAAHALPGTDIVYPVAVASLNPEHRQSLPDIKLRILVDYVLQQHQAVLMCAGNESTGGRFSWQTQIEYAMSAGIHAYQLDNEQITRFDDKEDLKRILDRPWSMPLPLVLLSKQELPSDVKYRIPAYVIKLSDNVDARAAFEL